MFRKANPADSVGSANVLVHEPQRYHFAMWEHFYALVYGSEASGPSYRESVEEKINLSKKAEAPTKKKGAAVKTKKSAPAKKTTAKTKKSKVQYEDDALSLAEELNEPSEEEESDE